MIPYRPITRIQSILDALGLMITFAYDDLVFVEHNAFLLQFEQQERNMSLFFNKESDIAVHHAIIDKLTKAGTTHDLNITPAGFFSMVQKANEQVEISFFRTTM